MGKVSAVGQTIVDLYCGIGYYTLPFLVHANAAVVHAFEWNINSIAALIVNLSMAGIRKDRCVLHYGDNSLAVFGTSLKNDVNTQVTDTKAPLPIDNFVGYTVRDVCNDSNDQLNEWALQLTDIADRVCLGLLPCSRGGWSAAVRVLRRSGGIIHVHYNVNASDIADWVSSMCEEFRQLFADSDKRMNVECIHIEKVKNYAPRVIHIVADLNCTPIFPV